MIFTKLSVGPMDNNCYIIGCGETMVAAVVDPGAEGERIISKLKELKLDCQYIILTHGHADHIGALQQVKKATGAQTVIHIDDSEMLTDPVKNLSYFTGAKLGADPADKLLQEGDVIQVGKVDLKIIHIPGHTPGGMCILVEDKLITGDTLFAGGIGRSDFPGGSHEALVASIKEKLFSLPSETKVYPGHGPSSTIGEEKRNNPYF